MPARWLTSWRPLFPPSLFFKSHHNHCCIFYIFPSFIYYSFRHICFLYCWFFVRYLLLSSSSSRRNNIIIILHFFFINNNNKYSRVYVVKRTPGCTHDAIKTSPNLDKAFAPHGLVITHRIPSKIKKCCTIFLAGQSYGSFKDYWLGWLVISWIF